MIGLPITIHKARNHKLLSYDAYNKANNFDFLRFLFAFIVFLVHAYVLSGANQFSIFANFLSSEVAVKSFFVVSGFLIFRSFENSSSIKSYFLKRLCRIYPAYIFIVLLCAFLGCFFSVQSYGEYFSLPVLKYVAANLLFLNFLQPNLPGLFENNTIHAVNGALWTLKIEMLFYLFVPFAAIAFRQFGRFKMLTFFYITSILYTVIMVALANQSGLNLYLELQRQLPSQIAFFIAGAAGYYYFQYLVIYGKWLALLALVTFALKAWLPWVAIEPIALAIIVVYLACVAPSAGNFGKYGDFSYGIYIIHFPILQLLISMGLFIDSPWLMLVIACLLIVMIAFLFWHLIEKPFLRKSSHYLVAGRG